MIENFEVLCKEMNQVGKFQAYKDYTDKYPELFQFVYIGLDRFIDGAVVKYLIPHEMNHMVRAKANGKIKIYDFMERVITEGLGSFCPIALHKMKYSVETISCALSSPRALAKLLLNFW